MSEAHILMCIAFWCQCSVVSSFDLLAFLSCFASVPLDTPFKQMIAPWSICFDSGERTLDWVHCLMVGRIFCSLFFPGDQAAGVHLEVGYS